MGCGRMFSGACVHAWGQRDGGYILIDKSSVSKSNCTNFKVECYDQNAANKYNIATKKYKFIKILIRYSPGSSAKTQSVDPRARRDSNARVPRCSNRWTPRTSSRLTQWRWPRLSEWVLPLQHHCQCCMRWRAIVHRYWVALIVCMCWLRFNWTLKIYMRID